MGVSRGEGWLLFNVRFPRLLPSDVPEFLIGTLQNYIKNTFKIYLNITESNGYNVNFALGIQKNKFLIH